MARRPYPVSISPPSHSPREPLDISRRSSSPPHRSHSSPSLNHHLNSCTTNHSGGDPSPSPPSLSLSPPSPMSDEEVEATASQSPPRPKSPSPPLSSSRKPSLPSREDCWSEPATQTLVEAWGSHHLALNRGNLRRKHWQEVADAVNAVHAHTTKQLRTNIQCKNRIDTLKKRYKIEKSRFSKSNGNYISSWPFFSSLNSLIGNSSKKSPKESTPEPDHSQKSPVLLLLPPPSAIPVAPRSKRRAPSVDAPFKRNFSVMAAAAAAMEAEEGEESESSKSSGARTRIQRRRSEGTEGYVRLAAAIEKFGLVYERVEEAKQRQMVELEKQRMQFAKDLEIQRMNLLMESFQLEKLKPPQQNSQTDGVMSDGEHHRL